MSPTRVLALTTGLLSLTNSDDELAVVVGHELAHAIAGHSREENLAGKHERLLLLPWLPMVIPGQTIAWLSASISPIFHLPAFVLTSPAQALVYWTLRRSRAQEREADYIGLVLMCEAGYDPVAAGAFWRGMHAREQEQILELQAMFGRGNVSRVDEWDCTRPHVRFSFLFHMPRKDTLLTPLFFIFFLFFRVSDQSSSLAPPAPAPNKAE
ncbi:hypothetical protein D0863_14296 [Hortaea werneckii]|uniref:Peptidase M48 domain-containing protein n=1 Tax=Hortaea werneckii TaxID=91943 RepID=A0A3M7CJP8_HORWE|nr:hypothetical protein D0863_14296 [Hortaea werneckii]